MRGLKPATTETPMTVMPAHKIVRRPFAAMALFTLQVVKSAKMVMTPMMMTAVTIAARLAI